MFAERTRLGLLPCLLLLVAAGACRDSGVGKPSNNRNNDNDGGMSTVTCSKTSDCGGAGVCVGGICESVSACSADEDCAAEGQVCHQTRFYCVQCDGRPGQCPTGETCQFDSTCTPVDTSTDTPDQCDGSCMDRSDCATDEICSMDGTCCPPPSRCRSPNDCPASRPMCNGATGECFGGGGCFDDMDCEMEPGCEGGACECVVMGSPPGQCEVRSDACQNDMDCFENGMFANKFCTLGNPPRRCAAAPPCAQDNDCANEGLVCDTALGSCQNGAECQQGTCPMGRTCGPDGRCIVENCTTNPSLCGPNETCDPVMLECVPNMSGACSVDMDCQAGYYCNNQSGMCEVGCRDNSECPGGVCNAQHMCEFPQGQFCGPCMDDSDCPAGGRCVDNPFTGKTCYEQCSMILNQPCSDPNDACVFGNCSCL